MWKGGDLFMIYDLFTGFDLIKAVRKEAVSAESISYRAFA